MLSLREQSAFEAFQYCVSCVLGDTSRVRQVACVGMAVADLWGGQQTFLEECQRMRINAVWWQRLQGLGIRVDMKAFLPSNRDYKRCAPPHSAVQGCPAPPPPAQHVFHGCARGVHTSPFVL